MTLGVYHGRKTTMQQQQQQEFSLRNDKNYLWNIFITLLSEALEYTLWYKRVFRDSGVWDLESQLYWKIWEKTLFLCFQWGSSNVTFEVSEYGMYI